MIREAELFVMSEQVLVEVVARITGPQWEIVLPPLLDRMGATRPTPIRNAVSYYAYDDACVPDLLAGRTSDAVDSDGDLLGEQPHPALTPIVEAACTAARKVDDGEAVVHADGRDLSARDYLLEMTITRSFLAHEIAMHLGSRACPLTEGLARGCARPPDRRPRSGEQPASSGSRCRCPRTSRGGIGSCSPPVATRTLWRPGIDPARPAGRAGHR